MNPATAKALAPKLEAIIGDHQNGAEGKPARKSRSLLPSPAPPPGTPLGEVAAWLTVALALCTDPVTSAVRFGRHEDGRLVLVLRSGQRVTFEHTADAFDARRLVRIVMAATGAQVQPYAYADALHIAGCIVRLAELRGEADERDEARDWGRSFLSAAARNTIEVADFATPAGRYEVIAALVRWQPPGDVAPYGPHAERSPIVLDTATGDRLVRTSDFAKHARGEHGRALSWAALHGRMGEVGWDHLGEVHQRQPLGHQRVKAHAYRVPAAWEDE